MKLPTSLTPDAIARESVFNRACALAAEGASVAARRGTRSVPRSADAGAGLVSSKTTSPTLFVNLAPSACAERRVKRLKRSVWASGHLHGIADKGKRPPVCWFVTLTYRVADDWRANHVRQSIDLYRKWCKKLSIPCRYTWVAEIQPKRLERTGENAVHYHLLAWLPRGVNMPQWDRSRGNRKAFWPHGMTNTQKAKAGVGYLMKYLSKLGELTRFPKGLRLYGIGGLDQQARTVRAWFNLPEWVKSQYGVGDVKRVKSDYLVCATGELLPPAFEVSFVPSGLEVRALRELPPRFHDGAYSTFPRVLH